MKHVNGMPDIVTLLISVSGPPEAVYCIEKIILYEWLPNIEFEEYKSLVV